MKRVLTVIVALLIIGLIAVFVLNRPDSAAGRLRRSPEHRPPPIPWRAASISPRRPTASPATPCRIRANPLPEASPSVCRSAPFIRATSRPIRRTASALHRR